MLKLNSTGGKLDITINDDTLFGTGRKATLKPHKGTKGTTQRTSNPPRKQETKAAKVGIIADKGTINKDIKYSRTIKKQQVIKQDKPKTKQEKKIQPVSKITTANKEQSMSREAAGVITQTNLENILSLLNVEGVSTGKILSPEQLSQLMASLGQIKPVELKGDNEVHRYLKPENNNHSQTRQQPRNISMAGKPREMEQENKNLTHNSAQADKQDKRLQWKKELDEQVLLQKKAKNEEKQKDKQFVEYNPWGRPGAGAPIRSQSGKVMADYHQRAAKEHNKTPKNENVSVRETIPLDMSLSQSSVNQLRPVATTAPCTSDAKTTLPVAMRSSFAVGAPGLVAHDTQQKRLQEIQWKQELEKQIEEKKEREKQRKLREDQEDFLNLSWTAKHLRQPPQMSPHTGNGETSSQITDKKPSQDTAAPQGTQDGSNPFLNALVNGSPKTHARGFGMQLMDPQAKEDADKKRLKMLEHQRAIQEQVEEKRRIKQQEREQRLKEEAIEEARLAKEREKLNQTFLSEQKKKREKEEEAKRISEALQQSVIDAYQTSLQVKADKRRRHIGGAGKDTQGGITSRSYVVSQASSDARHINPDRLNGKPQSQHDDNISVFSNYESPREMERKTYRSQDQTSQDKTTKDQYTYKEHEPVVPLLNLTRGNSPPVPTLRNKLASKDDANSPKSHREVSPADAKDNFHRTVSSYSEPADGSLALSSINRSTKESHDDPLSNSSVVFHVGEFNRPFSTLEDAFMIPYHRTDSATLPAQPETRPESNASQGMSGVPKKPKKPNDATSTKNLWNAPQNNGKTTTSMYRTASSHLKAEQTQSEVSPRRTKGNKSVQRHESQVPKVTPSPRCVINKVPQKEMNRKPLRKPTNTQRGKDFQRKVTKDHVTPRNDASSVVSTHREIPEPLPTARQEMIIQQLAALRQGLIIKERELKQDANMQSM